VCSALRSVVAAQTRRNRFSVEFTTVVYPPRARRVVGYPQTSAHWSSAVVAEPRYVCPLAVRALSCDRACVCLHALACLHSSPAAYLCGGVPLFAARRSASAPLCLPWPPLSACVEPCLASVRGVARHCLASRAVHVPTVPCCTRCLPVCQCRALRMRRLHSSCSVAPIETSVLAQGTGHAAAMRTYTAGSGPRSRGAAASAIE
jgi:hypothetical protein